MSVACPLCQNKKLNTHAKASDIEYFTSETEFDILCCESCDVLFVDPMLSDKLNDIYPDNYYSFVEGKKNIVGRIKQYIDERSFKKIVSRLSGSTLSVLDIGGGTGWLLDSIRSIDDRVNFTQVVDIDENAKVLAEKNGHHYFHGRFEEFSSDRKFDLILMLNLIEHVRDPRAILAKAAASLSSNGVILVKTPNFDALDARVFRHRSWAGFHTPRHFVLFNDRSFRVLAESAGLDVRSLAFTQGAPFWSISVFNELRRLGLVSADAMRPAIFHPLVPLLQAAFAVFDFARLPFFKLSQMVIIMHKSAAEGRGPGDR
jgi:2-polyprenyl-3-methyl-5-hydroxy-6-metoxy-1,4-benzoquinol methylase